MLIAEKTTVVFRGFVSRFPFFALAVFLGIGCCVSSVFGATAVVARRPGHIANNGHTDYRIVVGSRASAAEKTAAEELSVHLEKITGTKFSIMATDEYDGGPMIAVGFNRHLPESLQRKSFGGMGEEEVVIAAQDNILLLAGGSPRGILYAVYEYLHRLGVRWYSPAYTKIPQIDPLLMPEEPYRYNPPLVARNELVGNNATKRWNSRNRLSSMTLWTSLGEEYGSEFAQGPDMHTFHRMIPIHLLKARPHWRALTQNGTREEPVGSTWQLCLSNPEVRKYLVDRTMDYARENPHIKEVWLGQNDGPYYCQCENCKAFRDAHGGHQSALNMLLINEFADVLAREMPDRMVKTLAYSYALMPPENMKVRDNVIIMFCATGSFFAPIGQDPEREPLRQAVKDWGRLVDHMDTYLYASPFDAYWFPAPSIYSCAENIKWCHENGINRVYTHASGWGNKYGSELIDLRAWVYARILWNPGLDVQEVVEDFLNGYYGPAAPVVQEAIELTHEDIFDADGRIKKQNDSSAVPDYVNEEKVRVINRMFEDVYWRVEDNEYKKHLSFAWIPFLWSDFWFGYTGAGKYNPVSATWSVPLIDADNRSRYGKLAKEYMIEHNINAFREGGSFNPRELAVEKMGVPWEASKLESQSVEAVVVPEIAGQIFDFKNTSLDFSPLKPYWGATMTSYPMVSSWRDFINTSVVQRYTFKTKEKNHVELSTMHRGFFVNKKVSLENGALKSVLTAQSDENVEVSLMQSPMFDMSEDVFGIYPTVYVEKKDGSWSKRVLGVETDFWYITGPLDISDTKGNLIIAAQNRPEGVLMKFNQSKVDSVSFEYDRYWNYPEDQGRMLRITPRTFKKKLVDGNDKVELSLSFEILPNVNDFLGKMRNGFSK